MRSTLQRVVFSLYISSFVWITFDYLAGGDSVAMAIFGREIRQSHIAASASAEIKIKGCGGGCTEREANTNRQNKKCPFDPLSKNEFLHPFLVFGGNSEYFSNISLVWF